VNDKRCCRVFASFDIYPTLQPTSKQTLKSRGICVKTFHIGVCGEDGFYVKGLLSKRAFFFLKAHAVPQTPLEKNQNQLNQDFTGEGG
jgi:hypothetical protein